MARAVNTVFAERQAKRMRIMVILLLTLSAVQALYPDETNPAVQKITDAKAKNNLRENHENSRFHSVETGRAERIVEIGLLGFDMGISNSIIATLDLFSKTMSYLSFMKEFDIPLLFDREMFADAKIVFNPVSVRFSTANQTFFEFRTNLETRFYLNISDETIKTIQMLQNTANDPSAFNSLNANGEVSLAAYAFFETGLAVSKHIMENKLFIRAIPSVYAPLIYIKQKSISLKSYTSAESNNGFMGIKGTGAIKIYAPFAFTDINPGRVFESLGFDFSVNAVYKLLPELDIGTDISHIPMIPAVVKFRSESSANVNINVPDVTADYWKNPANIMTVKPGDVTMDYSWTLEDSVKTFQYLIRPLRFSFFLFYKPLGTYLFVINPSLGFSAYTALNDIVFNYSLAFTLNLSALSFKLGTALFENMFSHYVTLVLDSYNFEIDIGLSLHSHKFITGFVPEGLGISFALKFGY